GCGVGVDGPPTNRRPHGSARQSPSRLFAEVGQMTSAPSEPSLFVDIAFMTTPSVDVSASIHRMGEHIMNRGVSGSDPTDLAFHVLAHGEGKTLGTEPEPDLADRSPFGEFRKDRAEGVDDGCVGMKTHFAICFSPH